MLLKDRIALVTGSTNNIGLATARAFAREGAKVIIHSRHADEAAKIARELNGDSFAADVGRPEEIAALFDHIKKRHRRLDVLVNNVAAQASRAGVLELSLEEWNQTLATNLTGYFLTIQHAARLMQEQGGGSIINISAASGERASPGRAAYSVSKGGIFSLSKQAAVDLAPHKIRVNCVVSGIVGTPIGSKEMGNRKLEHDSIPLRRIGQPEEVAEAVLFLASDKASYITNAILAVDGGRMHSMGSASGG
jgi:NAD(P)-dependent dehydrogenase (short-subunit alcohol dehydrogenase family)